MDQQIRLQVKVSDKNKIYFEGTAYAVSSTNTVGPFDILSEHSNFVSIVKEYITIHESPDKLHQFEIERGILSVRENIVEVFIGI